LAKDNIDEIYFFGDKTFEVSARRLTHRDERSASARVLVVRQVLSEDDQ
jgi:hypothetical protein